MRPSSISLSLVAALSLVTSLHGATPISTRVEVDTGLLEGTRNPETRIHSFKGVPFAAPPIGDLRWKAPQPPKPWEGARPATKFGPRAMQMPVFGDMAFRSDGMGEDCLYLNVWTPAKSAEDRLPVLVYFYGGGFVAGDGSEGRYDGESMASLGIVTITVNYRLGVFGFLAHPELTEESPHKASGNYGLLDQHAALLWVQRNIHAFGGDPSRVTIAGESAGSISVSVQMASPLSKHLIAGAIGESGSILATLEAIPLSAAEERGMKLASALGFEDGRGLAKLRALPAEELLDKAAKAGFMWFNPTVDGYLLPKSPAAIYEAGDQARIPLLAGVNSEEMGAGAVLGPQEPTVENYRQALKRLYPEHADDIFGLYPATNTEEVLDAARDLAGDRFISYGTWKWADLASRTSRQPTFYYLYARPRPPMRPELGNATPGFAGGVVTNSNRTAPAPPPARGAVHSAEIEYALGNLPLNSVYAWTPEDHRVSQTMQAYFANFIKTGNPNDNNLPLWPDFAEGQRLVIDVRTVAGDTSQLRKRYELLDRINTGKP